MENEQIENPRLKKIVLSALYSAIKEKEIEIEEIKTEIRKLRPRKDKSKKHDKNETKDNEEWEPGSNLLPAK